MLTSKAMYRLIYEHTFEGVDYYQVLDSEGFDPIGEYITLADNFLINKQYKIV